MREPKITMLAWIHMDDTPPPKTTCLFTDGVQFWTGWYSPTDQLIYIKTGEYNLPLEISRVTYWAKLNNIIPILTA